MTGAGRYDDVLAGLETRLDTVEPGRTPGVEVLGYGEISVGLRVAALPGTVCKRMSGFLGRTDADAYRTLVERYVAALAAAGVDVTPTQVVVVDRADAPPVVYLVQPEHEAARFGHALLRTGDDGTLRTTVLAALDAVLRLAVADRSRGDGTEVAVDGQLSNWWIDPADGHPVLVDVGTPFLRDGGRHAIDLEVLHRPIPPGIRAYYRWRGEVAAYLDDYFDPRLVAVDLLGNFHKEGRPDRIPFGIGVVNDWLREVSETLGPRDPVTAEEVDAYYRKDAGLLALYLRLRRGDRFVRKRLLRRRYDYVLPGRIDR